MTPATVREAVHTTRACRNHGLTGFATARADYCDGCCDAIASAVLAAADAGETEGPWRVNKPIDTHSFQWFKNHWFVDSPEGPTGGGYYFPSEPEARAVCNALNRIHGRTA